MILAHARLTGLRHDVDALAEVYGAATVRETLRQLVNVLARSPSD